MPKQFAKLLSDRSTFQSTARRVDDPEIFQKLVVITHNDDRFIVAEQLAEQNIVAQIVLEPTRRDTAAAVAAAACLAARQNPETIVLILAADHLITDTNAFMAAVRTASVAASAGFIMTLGVQPTYPATGYGYIRKGSEIPGSAGCRVEKFVEKPDPALASTYVSDGYLWNSGYFLFRADVMLKELRIHAPSVLEAAQGALDKAVVDLDFTRLDASRFGAAPKISIDYAVMERTDKAGVLPVSFPWSDVGTWDSLWEVLPHDDDGNVLRGRVEILDTLNSLVHSDGPLTAVIGLENVVVVTTPDAVLVTSRDQSGKVKDLVGRLREQNCSEVTEHVRTYRPWGWYQRIDIGERFHAKRIMVKPGGRLSLQKHFHRAEHWVVVRGTADVVVNDRKDLVHENEAVYIPIGAVHRLANPGRIPLELIEVQVGSYTGEDDIQRLEDVYGR
jgi:mannose-1-phosphate guanylyltransferase/mannose-6-phosphate isomerase